MNIKVLTFISVAGAIMVSVGNSLCDNLLWSISNPMMAWYNYKIVQKEQAVLFVVFTVIAWFGVISLW